MVAKDQSVVKKRSEERGALSTAEGKTQVTYLLEATSIPTWESDSLSLARALSFSPSSSRAVSVVVVGENGSNVYRGVSCTLKDVVIVDRRVSGLLLLPLRIVSGILSFDRVERLLISNGTNQFVFFKPGFRDLFRDSLFHGCWRASRTTASTCFSVS